MSGMICVSCFFFQAEDGIRDLTVTGVQTCALPILGRIDEQPGGRRHQQVAVRDASAEEWIAGGRSLVHMRVEPIARQLREALDVLERDPALGGVEGIADRKLREGFTERMRAGLQLSCA